MFLVSQAELARLETIQHAMDALFREQCTTMDGDALKEISKAHGELAFVIERITRKQVTQQCTR